MEAAENICSCIAALASSQRYAPNSLVQIFPAESADGLCTESEAAGARNEDPGPKAPRGKRLTVEQRLKTLRRVATSLKPTSNWPPPECVHSKENQLLRDTFFKFSLIDLVKLNQKKGTALAMM